MKTFKDCKPGDIVFIVKKRSSEIIKKEIIEISESAFENQIFIRINTGVCLVSKDKSFENKAFSYLASDLNAIEDIYLKELSRINKIMAKYIILMQNLKSHE